MYDEYGFDKDGYDEYGFDESGFDKDGYDEYGFDESGFDKSGFNRYTGGYYDKDGFDKFGYDENEFNRQNINRFTGTKYDIKGYDKNGFNEYGFHRDTNIKRDIEGYDKNGFNKEGIHRETKTQYDWFGFDIKGICRDTGTEYNRYGFNIEGYNRDGYDSEGYDRDGYDIGGYDKNDFNKEGIHRETEDYYNKEGYDKYGFDKTGINRDTGTELDCSGYDFFGVDENYYNREGFNKWNGIHRETGTHYNKRGLDILGYSWKGYDEYGFNENGFNKEGIHRETRTYYNKEGYNKYSINTNGIDQATGKKSILIIAVEQYLASGQSTGLFCKKNNIDKQQFKKLLQEITDMYPLITKKQLEEASARSSELYIHKRQKLLNELVTKEKTFEEYLNEDVESVNYVQLMAIAKEEQEKKTINSLVINSMVSGQMEYRTYMELFVDEGDTKYYSDSIVSRVEGIIKIAKETPEFEQYVSELDKEKRRITVLHAEYVIGTLKENPKYDVSELEEAIRGIKEIKPGEIDAEEESKVHKKTELRELFERKEALIDEKTSLSWVAKNEYPSIYKQAIKKEENSLGDDIL